MVKQALQAPDYRLSAMGGLVHELKELLWDEFADVRVVHIHIPHECNKVAHELARMGSLRQDDVVFDPGSLAVCIHVSVTSDFSGSQG
jgi:hypothetical protein